MKAISFLMIALTAVVLGAAERPDSRVRTQVEPVRVVWATNAANAAVLASPRLGQVPEGRFLDGSGCRLSSANGLSAVVLDFGRELYGSLAIGNGAAGRGAKVRIRFGESVAETLAELGERGAQNDHSLRDFTAELPWAGSREFGPSGFRFVRIDAVAGTPDLQFVRAVSLMRPMKPLGAFRCSDERLNRVFETAVRTVHLCCQDYLWDGIKRDRLVWLGDMHPETRTLLSVFGAAPVLKDSLEYAIATTPPDTWMNTMQTYTLWWIRNLAEWCRYTGDFALARKHAEYLEKTFDHVLTGFDADGLWTAGTFLDWPTKHNREAEVAGTQGLALMAAEDAAFLARGIGAAALAAKADGMAARLKGRVLDPAGEKSAAALLALAGLRTPQEMYDSVLSRRGHEGVSTFYGYYMLEAMSAANENARALGTVRDYWGAMLDVGATSFWEDFKIGWTNNCFRIDEMPVAGRKDIHGDYGEFCYRGFRHSLCHGWSSGPAAWLIAHVLGLRSVEPGCKAVRVDPFLGDLDWAEGSLALPTGEAVRIRVTKNADGSLTADVNAPDWVRIVRAR